mgnify:CR=1 FL=1
MAKHAPLGAQWALLASLVIGPPGAAHAAKPWSLAGELAVSPYSEAPGETERPFRAVALGAHLAHRWDRFGAGLAVEANVFQQEDLDGKADFVWMGLVGLEGEVLMVGGLVRSRMGGGLALLLEGTDLDNDGVVAGFYLDLHPVGFRWPFEGWVLGVDPLTLLLAIPEPSAIPLIDIQYRAHVYAEVSF